MLENILPTATGGEVRRGLDLFATMPTTTKPVLSLFSYKNGNLQSLFAANETEIADITATPANALTGQTGGDWSVVQFVNANGDVFLRGVNGLNTPFVYNGVSFSTSPALTFAVGVTVTANQMSRVWEYQNRLFFIQKESMNVWYLPVSTIGGQLVMLPLGGVFSLGGSLLFGTTWSVESGDGLNTYCVFVSTEGEAAVFRGSNPADPDDWFKVGVYRIGRPLGPKAFIRAGGDLVINTSIGFVALSQAMQRDYAALSPTAVSYGIETAWNEAVALRLGAWNCEIWPERQMTIIALPKTSGQSKQMFVVNTRTGAWAKFTGWEGNCLINFNGRMFFGGENGKIIEAYVTGQDEGAPYTATYVPLFEDLRSPTSLKIISEARAVLRSAVPVIPKLSIQVDFIVQLPSVPNAPVIAGGNEWGSAVWGQAVWGAGREKEIQQDWVSAPGAGYAIAPAMQLTSGSPVPLDTEIVRLDITYEKTDIGA